MYLGSSQHHLHLQRWGQKRPWKLQTSYSLTSVLCNALEKLIQSVFIKEEDKDIIAFNDLKRLCFETEVAEPFDFKGKIAREVLREVRLDRGMVHRVSKNLDPNKAPGPDVMHPKVLMEVAEEIAEPVYMIYEEYLLTSSIPDYWEVANITSIFKGGDRKDPGNYRLVSLTSVGQLCKALEKLIREKILGSHWLRGSI